MITQPTPSSSSNGSSESQSSKEPKAGDNQESVAKAIRPKTDAPIWMDSIVDDWQKIVNKVQNASEISSNPKKSAARLRFGLPSSLLERVEPLLKHALGHTSGSESIEQLTELSESATITFLNLHGDWTAKDDETLAHDDPLPDARLLASFTAIIVAHQLRRTIRHGTDLQFERLIRSIDKLQQVEFDSNDPNCVLMHQWLTVELPLIVASQLPEIKHLKKNGQRAAKRFAEVSRELMDSDAWPAPNCLPGFASLIASWARSFKLIQKCKFKIDRSFQAQLDWAAIQFFRLHATGKKLAFASTEHVPIGDGFAKLVLGLSDDPQAKKIASANGLIPSRKKWKLDEALVKLPDPSCVSEWSESAMLRSSWLPKQPHAAIEFASPSSFIEIGAKKTLLKGVTTLSVCDDGQSVPLADYCVDVVCELHDSDVSYLELEIQTEHLKFFRQFLLSRNERFLYFADSIHKEGAGKIDYRLDLPLAEGIDGIPENGTRELYLHDRIKKGIQSLVLPLALPEWNSQRCDGKISVGLNEAGQKALSFQHSVELRERGGALYFPVFMDLDPKRSRLKRTWRSLTVAESLKVVTPDVAAAFRVQVDEQQWIFYRALRDIGNRTFIGQNFAGDFYAGRFKPNGTVEDLIQVQ